MVLWRCGEARSFSMYPGNNLTHSRQPCSAGRWAVAGMCGTPRLRYCTVYIYRSAPQGGFGIFPKALHVGRFVNCITHREAIHLNCSLCITRCILLSTLDNILLGYV